MLCTIHVEAEISSMGVSTGWDGVRDLKECFYSLNNMMHTASRCECVLLNWFRFMVGCDGEVVLISFENYFGLKGLNKHRQTHTKLKTSITSYFKQR